MQDPEPPAPTPLPLSELAPTPSENDLFGKIFISLIAFADSDIY